MVYGAQRHFQQYLSYIIAVSYIHKFKTDKYDDWYRCTIQNTYFYIHTTGKTSFFS